MGRPFEDLTKKTEFNLGSVFKVYYGDEGNGSSQQIELKPLRNNYTRTSTTLSAVPLIRGLSDSITKNDLVLYVVIEKKDILHHMDDFLLSYYLVHFPIPLLPLFLYHKCDLMNRMVNY